MSAAKHTPMVVAAARALCRQHAAVCNVDADDLWNMDSETFKEDAQKALDAAGAPELLKACSAIDTFFVFFDSHIPPNKGEGAREALRMVRAAIAKATGGAA
jgi:hypothetical protein